MDTIIIHGYRRGRFKYSITQSINDLLPSRLRRNTHSDPVPQARRLPTPKNDIH